MPAKKAQLTEAAASQYQSFISGIKLVGIALKSARCDVNHDSYFDALRSENAEKSISAGYALKELGDDFFESESKLLVEIKNQNGEGVLSVECVFNSHYHAIKPNKAFAKRFTESEARLIMWPFFREMVFDLTARMNIPPVTIPLSTER